MIELVRSPALLAYVAICIAVPLSNRPLPVRLFDFLVVLPVYVAVIHLWTRRDPPLSPTRPGTRRDVIGIAALGALIAAAAVWAILHPWPAAEAATHDSFRPVVDGWSLVESKLRNAGGNILLFGAVVTVLALVMGVRPRDLPLAPRRIGLGIALAALCMPMALYLHAPTVVLTAPAFALPAFCAQAFINGIPEELLFRGLVFPRLLALLRSPGAAIACTCMLFNAAHVPIHLMMRGDEPAWQSVALGPFGEPTGLVWAILCYRTRSIWPGALWHTSGLIFGILYL
jgi:membrane protease YdiL (CAAX protease family)